MPPLVNIKKGIIDPMADFFSGFGVTILLFFVIFGLSFVCRFYTQTNFPFALLGILLTSVLTTAIVTIIARGIRTRSQVEEEIETSLAEAQAEIESAPEKTVPAWDLARVTLEAYFTRNLNQNRDIFWFSVVVMFAGFFIISWGIIQAILTPNTFGPAAITTVAGVITEFFGATFLFIYRSTIQQASSYSETLERMNSVGMAMRILDTIPDGIDVDDLKSKTKANVAQLLIRQIYTEQEKPDNNESA